MTDRSPTKDRAQPRSDGKKLLILIGASALVYIGALGPVMGAVRGLRAADAARVQLGRRVLSLARQNRIAADSLRQAEDQLSKDLKQEQSLRSEIAIALAQTPPVAPPTPPTSSVALPTVNTTTGASGLP